MAYPFQTIQLRRGTAAEWVAANPVLAAGELGVELVTSKFKIGDGTTAWNSLGYATDVDLPRYFKLDQIVPQTVTGGMPIFSEGLTVGPPGFLQCDGHVYIGLTDPTAQLQVEHYCDGTSAYILRSALHPDYAQFAWGLSTDLGYVFFQSNAHGTGITLPITFWVNALRAWDISTGGHLLSGGTGDTVQNIQTGGTLHCHGIEDGGNLEILGGYALKFWNNGKTVQYNYILANGSNHIIASVNVPFQLQYGTLGSQVALSLSSTGQVVWNYDAEDCDFSIRKHTAGDAYYYNAGTDCHLFSGNVGIGAGAVWGTDAVDVLSVAIGTTPTTHPANVAQMFVQNRNGVDGTATMTVMNEDGVTPYHIVNLYGEMYVYESVVEVGIDLANQYHAVNTIATAGICKGWVFKAGSTGPIASFANYHATVPNTTLITDNGHGLLTGEVITICNSTNYSGKHAITKVDANTFYIAVVYVAEAGGSNWIRGSSLQALPGSAGIYRIMWHATILPIGANNNFKVESNLTTTDLDNMAASIRLTVAADGRPISAAGFATVADGDYIWLSVRNETDASNIIFRHVNLNVHKVG